jgi:hypothetical protein
LETAFAERFFSVLEVSDLDENLSAALIAWVAVANTVALAGGAWLVMSF